MSNYSAAAAAAAKNPPWQKQQSVSLNNQSQANLLNTGLLQYPQTAILQAQQLIQQQTVNPLLLSSNQYSNTSNNSSYSSVPIANVGYPTQQLNSTAFANVASSNASSVVPTSAHSGGVPKQRVFTGTITKRQDNFGFIDEDVFFQVDVCAKGSNPRVGDQVLVEAAFNPSMPFKWNATRIQVLSMDRGDRRDRPFSRFSNSANNSNYSPADNGPNRKRPDFRDNRDRRSFQRRSPDRKRKYDNLRETSIPRSKTPRKDDKDKNSKENSPRKSRSRSRSPRRRRNRPTPKYAVSVPQFTLDLTQADLLELRRRYSNMYIPSDFFITSSTWLEAFPPDRPFSLQHPCSFHVMSKDVPNYFNNTAVLDPPDADYLFSAKVMLLSMPAIEQVFKKCVTLSEDADKNYKESVHPSRLINFLVGIRGKNETMAIGGPWSESLDGPNPDKDPSVLIKTAIRTTKALSGIDLSKCTKWFKFVEIYYRRQETTYKGKPIPARVETVVIYLPDVWNCVPTQLEWDGLQINYKKMYLKKISKETETSSTNSAAAAGTTGVEEEKESNNSILDANNSVVKREPTHYSLLDIKNMKVQELRDELEARSLPSKGLKSQLTARLAKALKSEQTEDDAKGELEEEEEAEQEKQEEKGDDENNKEETEDKNALSEKEKQRLEKKFTIPESPNILVHPSATAKSGKFNCEVMSLSVLLDYRFDDAKEHSFEVACFAEFFNEMLMRDFGFQIFKAIHNAPEKVKEDHKEKKDDKKTNAEKDEENVDDKTKDEKTKDDKTKDDKSDNKESKTNEKKDDDNKTDKEENDDKKNDKKDKEDKDRKEEREKRERERKKEKEREAVKMYTENPFLLLCCTYFDTTHVGYLYERDLENLLLTLGLSLSRSQVKKLVQKVLTKDNFYYRKLTDKPVVDGTEKTTNFEIQLDIDVLKQLIEGNRKYLPVFVDQSKLSSGSKKTPVKGDTQASSDGLVMYQGCLLNIGNIQSSLEKSDAARVATENLLTKLRADFAELEKSYKRTKDKLSKATSDLKETSGQLTDTKHQLHVTQSKTTHLFNVVSTIYKTSSAIYENPTYNKNISVKSKEEEKEVKTEDKEEEEEEDTKEELKTEEVVDEEKSKNNEEAVENGVEEKEIEMKKEKEEAVAESMEE